MKLTICGSIAFYKEMLETKNRLEALGLEVLLPPSHIQTVSGETITVEEYYRLRKSITDDDSWIWDNKEIAMRAHFDKIAASDSILVLNYPKNGIAGYIGANTLLEMGLAFYLHKPIYLLNPLPEISYKEEILGMKPIVIGGDLDRVL